MELRDDGKQFYDRLFYCNFSNEVIHSEIWFPFLRRCNFDEDNIKIRSMKGEKILH